MVEEMWPASEGRRARWSPTELQRKTLERSYQESSFPDLEMRTQLAAQIGIEARQVQVISNMRLTKDDLPHAVAVRNDQKVELTHCRASIPHVC